jgi:hypothetical protein
LPTPTHHHPIFILILRSRLLIGILVGAVFLALALLLLLRLDRLGRINDPADLLVRPMCACEDISPGLNVATQKSESVRETYINKNEG